MEGAGGPVPAAKWKRQASFQRSARTALIRGSGRTGLTRRGDAVRKTIGTSVEERGRDLGLVGAASSECFSVRGFLFFSVLVKFLNSVVKSVPPELI